MKKWVAGSIRTIPSTTDCAARRCGCFKVITRSMQCCLAKCSRQKRPTRRAAAMHVVSDEADYLPNAFQLLAAGVRDENPRVRLEAIRGLSFFPTLESAKAALAALELPTDLVDRLHAGAYARGARAGVEKCV